MRIWYVIDEHDTDDSGYPKGLTSCTDFYAHEINAIVVCDRWNSSFHKDEKRKYEVAVESALHRQRENDVLVKAGLREPQRLWQPKPYNPPKNRYVVTYVETED